MKIRRFVPDLYHKQEQQVTLELKNYPNDTELAHLWTFDIPLQQESRHVQEQELFH